MRLARIIAIFVVFASQNVSATWHCEALCKYYAPIKSPNHLSLPRKAHKSYVISDGESFQEAYALLVDVCNDLGDEAIVLGIPQHLCVISDYPNNQ